MKTSVSHPMQIATIDPGMPGFGRVGVTFCPGKHDPHAMSGGWDRDLGIDLDAIRAWGAAAVVTLVELKELTLLGVEHLGEEVGTPSTLSAVGLQIRKANKTPIGSSK